MYSIAEIKELYYDAILASFIKVQLYKIFMTNVALPETVAITQVQNSEAGVAVCNELGTHVNQCMGV